MDSLGFYNLKIEKANAMFRYRRLQQIAAVFRFIELGILLIIVSRFTLQLQLPAAFKLSGEYFRRLRVTAFSPQFVFIVGNVIVVVLFLKSGQLSPKDGDKGSIKLDLYKEYVENCEKNRNVNIRENKKQRKQNTFAAREVVYDPYSPKEKKIHRTHSQSLKKLHTKGEAGGRELRRSLTERRQRSADYNEKPVVNSYSEDEMSSEEFRRTVEAFIARQQRFLREEEFPEPVYFET